MGPHFNQTGKTKTTERTAFPRLACLGILGGRIYGASQIPRYYGINDLIGLHHLWHPSNTTVLRTATVSVIPLNPIILRDGSLSDGQVNFSIQHAMG